LGPHPREPQSFLAQTTHSRCCGENRSPVALKTSAELEPPSCTQYPESFTNANLLNANWEHLWAAMAPPKIDMSRMDGGMGEPQGPRRVPLTALEWIWVGLAFAFSYWPSGPIGVLMGACFFVHYFFGGSWRWQLYGMYLLTLAVIPASVMESIREEYELVYSVSALVIPLLTAASSIMVPKVHLPEPTGPCRDIVRHSCVVDLPTDGLTFMLTVFYPSKIDLRDAQPAQYLRSGFNATDGFAKLAGVPGFLLNFIAGAHTPVFTEAWASVDPRAMLLTAIGGEVRDDAKLPLVVFSHGLGGVPDIYHSVITELCSHVSHAILSVAVEAMVLLLLLLLLFRVLWWRLSSTTTGLLRTPSSPCGTDTTEPTSHCRHRPRMTPLLSMRSVGSS
jgi:hypothetical protein